MRPRAKAKRKQDERTADEEAIAKFEAEITVVRAPAEKKPRNEVSTIEVVNIMADEIQTIYTEMGAVLDDANAHDKALVLWRHMSMKGVRARDVKIPYELCEEHG